MRVRCARKEQYEALVTHFFIFPSDTLVPFVDELVSDVYSGKLQAYYILLDSPEVERPIAVEDIGKRGYSAETIETNGKKEGIENHFKPSDASFVSFEQKYFYDTASRKIRTEVTKVFIARDAKTFDGTYVGAEPIFYIKLN